MLLTIALVFCIFLASSEAALAVGTAKVVASSGKIRAAADTTSDTKASVKKGDKLDVIASKKDGSGYTWYKVYINDKDTGYIRADLVTVEGTISEEKESSTTSSTTTTSESNGNKTVVGSNNSTETEKKEETKTEVAVVNVSETDVATAKAKDDVRVRKGAGTNFDVAGQAKKDTEVTVSGVASDSEGKNWYQVSFNEGDKTVNGFIREDFLEVLTYVEVVEEEIEEVVEEEPVVENNDYYLSYMQNDAGEMDWYLFDNINGTSQSLTQILNAVEQLKTNELEEAEQISTMRMIVFALAAVVVILIITVTILIFKLRDAYEYEYEDDEEDDEEEEDEEDAEEEEEDDDEEEEVKAPRKSFLGFGKKKEVVEEDEDEEDTEEEEEEIKEIKPVKTSQGENKAWQSKDFLELDDDMEFEFLDL